MTFREQLHADLGDVFLNLEAFAETRMLRGRSLICIVDEGDSEANTGGANNLRNASGLGLLACDRKVLCRAEDVEPLPRPGEQIEMDGWLWLVGDGVSVTEGLLTLPLNRAY